jgi:SAM-dependent methyltransferase
MTSNEILETKREILDDYNKIWKISQSRMTPEDYEKTPEFESLDLERQPLVEAARRYKNFSSIEVLIEGFLRKNPFDHKSVLSIGCGVGKDVETVRKLFPSAKMYGIDISRYALKEARKHSDADFVCASAENLPFKEDLKFDMLIAGHTLDLFTNEDYLKGIIGELTKYSAEKSRFYMSFYGDDEQHLEKDSCTPIGNVLDQFGWKIIHGSPYNLKKGSKYTCGAFWVNELV